MGPPGDPPETPSQFLDHRGIVGIQLFFTVLFNPGCCLVRDDVWVRNLLLEHARADYGPSQPNPFEEFQWISIDLVRFWGLLSIAFG